MKVVQKDVWFCEKGDKLYVRFPSGEWFRAVGSGFEPVGFASGDLELEFKKTFKPDNSLHLTLEERVHRLEILADAAL